jgi:hypothetical protein
MAYEITLTLSWEELARLRFIANATPFGPVFGVQNQFYWIEQDRIDALSTVLDRNGWTTDVVVARLRHEWRKT